MENLSFDNLPKVIDQIRIDVNEIKALLNKLSEKDNPTSDDKPLSVKEAADFLNLSVQTVYSKSCNGELPVHKLPNSKRNYYFQKDLLDYVKVNRRKSNTEIKSEAENFLITTKKYKNHGSK